MKIKKEKKNQRKQISSHKAESKKPKSWSRSTTLEQKPIPEDFRNSLRVSGETTFTQVLGFKGTAVAIFGLERDSYDLRQSIRYVISGTESARKNLPNGRFSLPWFIFLFICYFLSRVWLDSFPNFVWFYFKKFNFDDNLIPNFILSVHNFLT